MDVVEIQGTLPTWVIGALPRTLRSSRCQRGGETWSLDGCADEELRARIGDNLILGTRRDSWNKLDKQLAGTPGGRAG